MLVRRYHDFQDLNRPSFFTLISSVCSLYTSAWCAFQGTNVSYVFRDASNGLTLAHTATTQSRDGQSENSECIPITGSRECMQRDRIKDLKKQEALSRERGKAKEMPLDQ